MEIGLIDVDNKDKLNDCFPNLALMKLSSYHKKHGDSVQWYDSIEMKHYDRVYMSKVFSFTEDFPYYVNADEVIRGGYWLLYQLDRWKRSVRQDKRHDSVRRDRAQLSRL